MCRSGTQVVTASSAPRWPSSLGYTALAIRSAIMIVVGLSATDGTTGMIDASTTRNPDSPLTAPLASTTAHGSSGPPIGAVAAGCPYEARLEATASAS